MFGMRTPVAKPGKSVREDIRRQSSETEEVGLNAASHQQTSVRRSIGEWESAKPDTLSRTSTTPKKTVMADKPKPKPNTLFSQERSPKTGPVARRISVEAVGSLPKAEKPKYLDRLLEARACVAKAKLHLGNSRNIKTEIKTEVIKAKERLYQLVKESECIKGKKTEKEKDEEPSKVEKSITAERDDRVLIKALEDHKKLIKENTDRMDMLKNTLQIQQELQETKTYASVAAACPKRQAFQDQTALHSIVVTAKDDTETGEEVLNRIRKVINAKEGGIEIEKIRKAKDRKVIVGCRTEKDKMVKDKLRKEEENLNVMEMTNRNPLVIIRDVFKYNSDEDILNALENQNKDIFAATDIMNQKPEILYKKKTRNLHTQHVVMRVPPQVWQRMVTAGSVRIDLQRVRVADQSPLVQCFLCLGYGHGRRFCQGTLEKCSHCGGPHMRTECADYLANATPSCCNCVQAKVEKADHNAFSQDCTIRRKWDTLARATIAYC